MEKGQEKKGLFYPFLFLIFPYIKEASTSFSLFLSLFSLQNLSELSLLSFLTALRRPLALSFFLFFLAFPPYRKSFFLFISKIWFLSFLFSFILVLPIMGKFKSMVNTPKKLAEFRRKYNFPEDVEVRYFSEDEARLSRKEGKVRYS